jgi:ferredoxin/flavodoxin---NADP+ reductase
MSLTILIVGSGPAGCYVCEQLLKHNKMLSIDIIDKNPYPFGLLRTGVAPDHERIKGLQRYFEKSLDNETVTFYANVEFGVDITYETIKNAYHAIFICTGSATDNRHNKLDYTHDLNCGSLQLVNWYNGHPYNKSAFKPEFLGKSVGIIGLGNVALDIARIFLKEPSKLASTEIPEDVIDFLKAKPISTVHIFVRRGPAQAKCTPKELAELLELDNVCVNLHDFRLSETDLDEAKESNRVQKNIDLFKNVSRSSNTNKKQLHIHFYSKLKQCSYSDSNLNLLFTKTKLIGTANQQKLCDTENTHSLSTQYLISSIGYKGTEIAGIPFNSNTQKLDHIQGHVTDNIFTAGWIKRGPTGVIGTNKRDAQESVNSFISKLDILKQSKCSPFNLKTYLEKNKRLFFTFQDWKKIDQKELDLGLEKNKNRVKISDLNKIKSLLSS